MAVFLIILGLVVWLALGAALLGAILILIGAAALFLGKPYGFRR